MSTDHKARHRKGANKNRNGRNRYEKGYRHYRNWCRKPTKYIHDDRVDQYRGSLGTALGDFKELQVLRENLQENRTPGFVQRIKSLVTSWFYAEK